LKSGPTSSAIVRCGDSVPQLLESNLASIAVFSALLYRLVCDGANDIFTTTWTG
jgi:hypothetical protein